MRFYGTDIKEGKSLWFSTQDRALYMVDQRLLPEKFEVLEYSSVDDVAKAIKDMVVRGAPAIGVAAAWGMVLAAIEGKDRELAADILRKSRPTAHDLFYAVDYMLSHWGKPEDMISAAKEYEDSIVDRCRRIGEYGAELIKDGMGILTHCNAGALATVDYGTALAPMRVAHNRGIRFFVYVDETRPRLQGAKLTSWELLGEGIEHAIIADNAAGYYMYLGKINMVITGADRITANGDAANKIGTYEKAVVAKENGIPFYIAAPISTYDPSTSTGKDIPIEERAEEEVLYAGDCRIAPEGARALNPAFDIIPAKYITGYITEYGIFKPDEIGRVFRERA